MAHCPICDEDHDDISFCGKCDDPSIAELEAQLARRDVEIEAWRSGRMERIDGFVRPEMTHRLRSLNDIDASYFPTIDAAVDALIAEREEE